MLKFDSNPRCPDCAKKDAEIAELKAKLATETKRADVAERALQLAMGYLDDAVTVRTPE